MQHLLKHDTQVYKQFVENESFKRFVGRHGVCAYEPVREVFDGHFSEGLARDTSFGSVYRSVQFEKGLIQI